VSTKKQPQDHKRKAVDRLRAESDKVPGIAETQERRLTIEGKAGTVTVATLNMLDWDAAVPGQLAAGDYLAALCGMVSDEDAALLRAARPTIGAMMTAVYAEDEETGEASVGEQHAS
jgi:hypothetical protein